MLRLGPSLNIELLEFDADQQQRKMPSKIDMRAGHIAFFVDDILAAAESLRKHGAELLQGPLEGAGEEKKREDLVLQDAMGSLHGDSMASRSSTLRTENGEPTFQSEGSLVESSCHPRYSVC
jgi:hypothetical protein